MSVEITQPDHLTFEAAATRAEEIVRRLEQENLPLEESLALYEEGNALLRHCDNLLEQAQLKVTRLSNCVNETKPTITK